MSPKYASGRKPGANKEGATGAAPDDDRHGLSGGFVVAQKAHKHHVLKPLPVQDTTFTSVDLSASLGP